MIICLIGQSSSGKSTIENELVKYGDMDKLISYTTRPMRENEVDGESYFFIKEEEFLKLEKEKFFQEVAQYREWYYGMSLEDKDIDNKDYIAVVTVHGYEELKKHTDNIIAIHVYVPERERILRQIKRGDDIDEVIRRIHTDRKDFKNVLEICDFVVKNNNIEESTEQIINIINLAKQRG